MKEEMIKLLREHLSKRQEPEIHALINGLDRMSEEEVKGVARLVIDVEMIFEVFRRKHELEHAYDRFL